MGLARVLVSEFRPIPDTAQPLPDWGEQFRNDSGFSFDVLRWTVSVYIDRRITRGDEAARLELLGQGHNKPVAHLLDCVGQNWRVDSEMVGPTRAGLIMYTAAGKALASGQVDLESGAPELYFKLATLYEGITNRFRVDFKAGGKYNPDGTASGYAELQVSDAR